MPPRRTSTLRIEAGRSQGGASVQRGPLVPRFPGRAALWRDPSEVDQLDMTKCIGIHSARLLAGIGIAPVNARHILESEFQLTTSQADAAVAEAYRLETHPAEVGGEPGGRGGHANLHVDRDDAVDADHDRIQIHF